MLLIEHRVNTLEHLRKTPADRGIEIDIRDYDGDLILTHDPFQGGERLENLLKEYRHSLMVLNVKCDGLEDHILSLMKKYSVRDFFFLDVANPTLVKLVRSGEKRVAVRYSEYEPVESALAFAGLADWVWVDCFTDMPMDRRTYDLLNENFRICLVSPELQKHGREQIHIYRERLQDMPISAVCTDFCEDWIE